MRNRLDVTRSRIAPQFVFLALAFEVAAELAKMTQQFALLHETTTVPFSS